MHKLVFYSWQSDLPNSVNRGFIQQALEKAAGSLAADDSIDIEPVIDRDTQGVSGSPDIAATIFGKISSADVFVADVSIVCKQEGARSTPNPNVLIELGYAMKALGYEKIILLFNEAFGKISDLPFDLRTRRITLYNAPDQKVDKSSERNSLQKKLEDAIRSAINNRGELGNDDIVLNSVLSSIENGQANRVFGLRKILKGIFDKIMALEPKKAREGGTVDDLLTAINKTQEITVDFSKISEAIAIANDKDSALEVCKWFGNIFEKYELPQGFQGTSYNSDQDYFKFIGHELFVSFTAFLIREQRWEVIEIILNEPIPMRYMQHEGGAGHADWAFASRHLYFLEQESRERQRISVHSDILSDRHGAGTLSQLLSLEDFTSADFFLFLASKLLEKTGEGRWYPRSVVNLRHTPLFIKYAARKHAAEKLVKVFKLSSLSDLKNRLEEMYPEFQTLVQRGHWTNPIRESDIKNIGMS